MLRAICPGDIRFAFESLDEWERWLLDVDSLGLVLNGLSAPDRRAARADLRVSFEPFTGDEGAMAFPGLAVCATASRPD